MSVQRITDFINNKRGIVQDGLFIQTSENIISDKLSWCGEDQSDFSTSPYWLTTDDGQDPVGIDNDAELNELMSTVTFEVESVDEYRTPDDMTGLYIYFKGTSVANTPPGVSFNEISRRLAVLPVGMCLVVDYRSFL